MNFVRSKSLAVSNRDCVIEFVKSLLEIEEAIAKLPAKARRQLVKDIPALCPDEFPPDGWDSILNDETPRPTLSSYLDHLDSEYKQGPEGFNRA